MGLFDNWLSGGSGSAGNLQIHQPETTEDIITRIKDLSKHLGLALTDADIHALTQGRLVCMPPEQQAEWYKLIEARGEQNKLLKIDTFKALPATMRQYIIDSIIWTKGMNHINHTSVPMSQEEINFERLSSKYIQLTQAITGHTGYSGYGGTVNIHSALKQMMHEKQMGKEAILFEVKNDFKYAEIRLNENIVTVQQLIDAHAEQCVADGITGDLNK